jgi:hypothetical protein
MKILKEFFDFENKSELIDEILTEQDLSNIKSGKLQKKYILRGVLQRADSQNGNGRIYPRSVLEKEVKNYSKLIKNRRAMGELDHSDQSIVELKNVSHLVTDVWWEGNDVVGKVEILSSPSGMILRSLIDDNVTLGISSRGLGSTRQEGGRTVVEEDFQLICWDFVSDPSTEGAFMMKEARENGREVSSEELLELKKFFDKNYVINRMLNDILGE